MLKGFKEFVMRGNLIELAVAFIMATAFTEVVKATVALIMDVLGKLGGTPDFSNYQPGGVKVGAWFTAIITFVILAAVVYFFIVVPYNKLQARRANGEEPSPPSEEITLLTQIRDLLSDGRTHNQP
jgi:large conductance mechanosensitive channel